MEASRGGGRSRSLGNHVLLQLLQRGHEGLLQQAIASSPSECLVLLPQESQLRGVHLDQSFLETHILQGTPYGDSYINLRGQEVERRGDEFITSLGFRAKVSASILCEERMVEEGSVFLCLLISGPLLRGAAAGGLTETFAAAAHRTADEGCSSSSRSSSRRQQQHPAVSSLSLLSPLSAAETQQKVKRLLARSGPQGLLAEQRIEKELGAFKTRHVLVPGRDAALAQRLGRLVAACFRHLPANVADAAETECLMERFVWLQLHDRLWPFFLETAAPQQAAVERGLETIRADLPAALESLGLRRDLRGVVVTAAANELDKISSLVLPHEKLQQLSLTVEAIHAACNAALGLLASQTPLSFQRKEPVEVSCEDLVALLLLSLCESGGASMVASYVQMAVLLLQQKREVRFEKAAFYLTALHSALSYAARLHPQQKKQSPAVLA